MTLPRSRQSIRRRNVGICVTEAGCCPPAVRFDEHERRRIPVEGSVRLRRVGRNA